MGSFPKLAKVSVVRTKATLTRHRTNFRPVENSCVHVLCSNGITLTNNVPCEQSEIFEGPM